MKRSDELVARQVLDSLNGTVLQGVKIMLSGNGVKDFFFYGCPEYRNKEGRTEMKFRNFPLNLLQQGTRNYKVDIFVDKDGMATIYPETVREI